MEMGGRNRMSFRKKSAAGTPLKRVAWGKSGEKDFRVFYRLTFSEVTFGLQCYWKRESIRG
jgi:hypothetical protein